MCTELRFYVRSKRSFWQPYMKGNSAYMSKHKYICYEKNTTYSFEYISCKYNSKNSWVRNHDMRHNCEIDKNGNNIVKYSSRKVIADWRAKLTIRELEIVLKTLLQTSARVWNILRHYVTCTTPSLAQQPEEG